jgi:hypothetical protein
MPIRPLSGSGIQKRLTQEKKLIETALKYWPFLLVLGSMISSWVAWSARKQFVVHSDLSNTEIKVGKRIGAVENRVMTLEQDMAIIKTKLDTLPTKEDIANVSLAVSKIDGTMRGIESSIRALERQTHLLMRAGMGIQE